MMKKNIAFRMNHRIVLTIGPNDPADPATETLVFDLEDLQHLLEAVAEAEQSQKEKLPGTKKVQSEEPMSDTKESHPYEDLEGLPPGVSIRPPLYKDVSFSIPPLVGPRS